MGREATCECLWAGRSSNCRVVLEPGELIFRGDVHHRIPINQLSGITVKKGELHFHFSENEVALLLGEPLASRWAKALQTAPPSLAKKLGITAASRLLVIGSLESPELEAAVAEAGSIHGNNPDLIIAITETAAELGRAMAVYARNAAGRPPLWIVYPKGKRAGISESMVREELRNQGLIDTKVVSVSSKLTALRFTRRQAD